MIPTLRTILAVVTLALLASGGAIAQDWPQRGVRILVPFAAGGNTDLVARMTAARLQALLGQSVTVENRTGAGGAIALETLAKAPPDGYTLAMSSTGPHVVLPSLMPKIPYDTLKDFEPISNVSRNALVLVVHPSVPVNTLAELVALAKREPGKLEFGSGGPGSTTHLAGEMLSAMAGIKLVHVPFRGGAPAMSATVAGEVKLSFNNMADALPQMKAGKVRAIAVTSVRRQMQLPELPTMIEAGLAGYEAGPWNGLVAPRGTPPAVVAKLASTVRAIVAEPEFRAKLIEVGSEPIGDTPDEFRAYIAQELARWSKVVRESGAKLE
jgi:tripartite-type tricarboxylate transporter receptor subunit TctC